MYNPLLYNPLNAWFAFSTLPVRVWTAALRGTAEGMAKDDAENDRTAADNVKARFSESAGRPKRRVAAAAVRNGHKRSGRVKPRGKKVRRRRAA